MFVMRLVLQSLVQGNRTTAAAVVRLLCRQSLAGPAIGLAFGLFLVVGLDYWSPGDSIAQLGLTLTAAFGAFVVAEDLLRTNGILAVVACGFVVAMLGKPKKSTAEPLELFW